MKTKTKYSYFRHAATNCFGNPGGMAFLIRRDNKTNEYCKVCYNDKMIEHYNSSNRATYMRFIAEGTWLPANQKEINKIKRLYREPKYLYYRHSDPLLFGNPGSVSKYLMRFDTKAGVYHSLYFDKKECNYLYRDIIFDNAVKKGVWIPARQKEIKLAIKLNK